MAFVARSPHFADWTPPPGWFKVTEECSLEKFDSTTCEISAKCGSVSSKLNINKCLSAWRGQDPSYKKICLLIEEDSDYFCGGMTRLEG